MGWIKHGTYYGCSDELPGESGNYAIYIKENNFLGKDKCVLMYIGTAINIRNRIKKHTIMNVLHKLADAEICWFDRVIIKCCTVGSDYERKRREYNLINRLNPLLNTQGTQYAMDKSIS